MYRQQKRRAAAFLGLISLLNASPGRAGWEAAPVWSVDRQASRVTFSGTQTGEGFSGDFGDFDVEIAFDPDNLAASSIIARFDLATAKTGDRQRDRALPGKDWFAVSEHPRAIFEARDIRSVAPGQYEAHGALTLRDATRPVILPFALSIDGASAIADGRVVLMRTDFGVGRGEFETGQWVGLEVTVAVHIEAIRAQ